MPGDSGFLIEPTSDRRTWLTGLNSIGYSSFECDDFEGSIRALSAWGIPAFDIEFASRATTRVERTHRDVRADFQDFYKASFLISGRSTLVQNDRVSELAPGGCVLVDMARPASIISHDTSGRWLSLYLPRQSLSSCLGFEPSGGVSWHGAVPANRLLYRLVLDAVDERDPSSAPAEPHMQLAVYDLLGALLAVSDLPAYSSYTDKLFRRICDIARGRFSDPELSVSELAREAGISSRYLQKLFTARGTTCSRFIQSLRLDHAAHLLARRRLTGSAQPLSQIAYACGFGDYAHFYRTFRLRFGCTPSAASKGICAATNCRTKSMTLLK